MISMMYLISCSGRNDNTTSVWETRIEHLVLFKFNPIVTSEQKQEVINRFMMLNNSLKEGKQYVKIEYGFPNNENTEKESYEVGFRVTFNSLADRDYYVGNIDGLSIPDYYDHMHDAFKNFVGPFLDTHDPQTNGVLVFDYISNVKGNGSIPDSGDRWDQWILIKLKTGVSQAQKHKIINGFLALKSSKKNGEPYITFMEYGEQNSKEGANKGFELAFRVSFTSLENRNYFNSESGLTKPRRFDSNQKMYWDFVTPFLDKVFVYAYPVKRQ